MSKLQTAMASLLILFSMFNLGFCCPGGKVSVDGYQGCFDLFNQGPCGDDEILILNFVGQVICQGFEDESNNIVLDKSEIDDKIELDPKKFALEKQRCFDEDKMFWPLDGQCYPLLTQGPCPKDHWLVLKNSSSLELEMQCSVRVCPCDPSNPILCEVEMPPGTSDCRCKVALAAEQDGICRHGEQLLVNPLGYGECGCVTEPPHLEWNDGLCYPLMTQGPCPPHQVYMVDEANGRPVCRLLDLECPENHVRFNDECHELGERGPCGELETVELDINTFMPYCKADKSKVKRVFNLIPSVKVKFGNVGSKFKVRRRIHVKRKSYTPSRYYRRKSSPKSYVSWLKSYRGN